MFDLGSILLVNAFGYVFYKSSDYVLPQLVRRIGRKLRRSRALRWCRRYKAVNTGTRELVLKNFERLSRDDVCLVECPLGEYNWKVAVTRAFRQGQEVILVVLQSANDAYLSVRAKCTVVSCHTSHGSVTTDFPHHCVAPHGSVSTKLNPVYPDLTNTNNGFLTDGRLKLGLTIESVERMSPPEGLVVTGEDASLVNVELLNEEMIKHHVEQTNCYGIGDRCRADLVSRKLLFEFTEKANSDGWVLRRDLGGNIVAACPLRCLAPGSSLLDTWFSEPCCGGCPEHTWFTLFDGGPGNRSDPITEDTLFLFCKIYDPLLKSFIYGGHLLMSKSSSCPELFTTVAEKLEMPAESDFFILAEVGNSLVRPVNQNASFEENWLTSGATIIVCRDQAQGLMISEVEKDLTSRFLKAKNMKNNVASKCEIEIRTVP